MSLPHSRPYQTDINTATNTVNKYEDKSREIDSIVWALFSTNSHTHGSMAHLQLITLFTKTPILTSAIVICI